MNCIKNNGNMFFVCVTVGLVLLASKFRDNVFRGVKQICDTITNTNDTNKCKKIYKDNCTENFKISLDKVILADSVEKCNYAIQRLRSNLSHSILGFDCEWVNEKPVSLLQLATYNGECILFRLGKIGCVPPKLKELLANRRLLKVGVASYEDGRKLSNDYGCPVLGTLDLRTLASRLNLPSPKSLAALCMQYLNIEMNKIIEVRCGDWNADTLTDEQITYAAYDAHAAVLIYHEILKHARRKLSFWQALIVFIKNVWNNDEDEKFHCLPSGVIDERYKVPRDSTPIINKRNLIKQNSQITPNKIVLSNKQLPTRNKPLYHNCYLEAPDGEILCTCDRKKAEWYLSKQLGKIVKEDPLTVRLKFEPSGRAMGEVGRYYTQVKVNQCVVCGSNNKFIRKNVVPREYRKYFPLVMKAHQSHDVLLLCPPCHEISSNHDLQLRRKLTDICDAPMCGPKPRMYEPPRNLQKHQIAVKILRENIAIPSKRRGELEMYIKSFTGHPEVTPAVLDALHESFIKEPPASRSLPQSQSHGQKVVEYFQKTERGLVELEKLWREHFLTTMKPQFLPKLWSISHNQERLVMRQTQNRIEPCDAKVAGLVN